MKEPTIRTRREFLSNCGVATLGLTMPEFITRTARDIGVAAGWEPQSGRPLPGFRDDRVLVVVQLSGGNDGLNTVIPHADDAYHRVRPRLAIPEANRIRVDDETSFNATLSGLKGLYDDGVVSVVEGVGYPNPNRSHFRSMEIWHTASEAETIETEGWIGRYFDNNCLGAPQPLAGVFVGKDAPQAFSSQRGMGVAFESPENFGWVAGTKGDDLRSFKSMNRTDLPTKNKSLDFLRHVTGNAVAVSEKLRRISQQSRNSVTYEGDPLSRQLAIVARLIAGGLGTRIYYVSFGGFDTHRNQAGQHLNLLRRYSAAVTSFYTDLKRMGQSHRVLTMTFSEFGRRVAENASGGTDHGTAAPMFLIGDAVRGGRAGVRPSLTNLDRSGDLNYTTDFRSVYASVLRQWLAADSTTALGGKFPEIELISA